jgi:hypothetical protein
MSSQSRMVGVVGLRRKLDNPWISESLAPHAVLSDAPAVAPGAPLGPARGGELVYLGPAELVFWTGETGHYRDNLVADPPKLWVSLNPRADGSGVGGYDIGVVTANPYEGEALSDGSGLLLEAVDMPADIAADLARFVEAHHVEQVFVKRKRDGKGRRGGRGEGRDGPG